MKRLSICVIFYPPLIRTFRVRCFSASPKSSSDLARAMRDRRKRQLTPEAASEMGKKRAANAIRLADKPGNLRTGGMFQQRYVKRHEIWRKPAYTQRHLPCCGPQTQPAFRSLML